MILALLTHGAWGKSLLTSAELIVGPIKDVVCFPVQPDRSCKEYVNEIEGFINKNQEDILLMADLMGGSTFHAAGKLSTIDRVQAICGLSLELLILADELRREYPISALSRLLIERARDKIVDMETILGKE